MGGSWWKRVLDAVKPPREIGELWDGTFDWLDDYEQGWTFEKLYPITDISQEPHVVETAMIPAKDIEMAF